MPAQTGSVFAFRSGPLHEGRCFTKAKTPGPVRRDLCRRRRRNAFFSTPTAKWCSRRSWRAAPILVGRPLGGRSPGSKRFGPFHQGRPQDFDLNQSRGRSAPIGLTFQSYIGRSGRPTWRHARDAATKPWCGPNATVDWPALAVDARRGPTPLICGVEGRYMSHLRHSAREIIGFSSPASADFGRGLGGLMITSKGFLFHCGHARLRMKPRAAEEALRRWAAAGGDPCPSDSNIKPKNRVSVSHSDFWQATTANPHEKMRRATALSETETIPEIEGRWRDWQGPIPRSFREAAPLRGR